MLSDWRLDRLENISRTAEYEDRVVQWLVKDKTKECNDSLSITESSSLVLEIARDKLNKKYDSTLSDRQKKLIRTYVFVLNYE